MAQWILGGQDGIINGVKVHLLNSRKPPNNINNPILLLIPVLVLDIQDIYP